MKPIMFKTVVPPSDSKTAQASKSLSKKPVITHEGSRKVAAVPKIPTRGDKYGDCVGVFVVLWEKLVCYCQFQSGL